MVRISDADPAARGDLGNCRDIGQFQGRIGRRLDPHNIAAHSCADHLCSVGDVDGSKLDVALRVILREQRAHAEVAEGWYHDDLGRQCIDDG